MDKSQQHQIRWLQEELKCAQRKSQQAAEELEAAANSHVNTLSPPRMKDKIATGGDDKENESGKANGASTSGVSDMDTPGGDPHFKTPLKSKTDVTGAQVGKQVAKIEAQQKTDGAKLAFRKPEGLGLSFGPVVRGSSGPFNAKEGPYGIELRPV